MLTKEKMQFKPIGNLLKITINKFIKILILIWFINCQHQL